MGALSPVAKRPGREADHSRLLSAEVSNGDTSLTHPPTQYTFKACTWMTFYCVHFILSVSSHCCLSRGHLETFGVCCTEHNVRWTAGGNSQRMHACSAMKLPYTAKRTIFTFLHSCALPAQPDYSCVLFDLTANSDVSPRHYWFTAARNWDRLCSLRGRDSAFVPVYYLIWTARFAVIQSDL
jgi:hypothetical protein